MFIENGIFDIALPIVLEGDKAKVAVPVLESILKPGNYGMRLEMVLGGCVYTPFRDTLEFNAPPSIKVENTKPVEAPAFFVRPATPTVAEAEDRDISDNGKSEGEPDNMPSKNQVAEEAPKNKYHEEFAKLLQTAFEASKK